MALPIKKLPIKKVASAGIDPFVGGALIMAGTSLISGILSGISEAKRRKQELLMQANQIEFEGKQRSAESMANHTQNSFAQLMDTYKHSLT